MGCRSLQEQIRKNCVSNSQVSLSRTKSVTWYLSHIRDWEGMQLTFNTQNMTNPTFVSPVKMEYGWNFSISGLKMMVKSGLGKIFLKFLHALTMSFLLLNLYFWSKFPPFYEINLLNRKWQAHEGISKIFFLDHFSPSFLGQKLYFWIQIPFEGKNDVWISQVRRVNEIFSWWFIRL